MKSKIWVLRNMKGKSIKDAAEDLNFTMQQYRTIEESKRLVSEEEADNLAAYYNTEAKELFNSVPPKYKAK